MNTKAILMTIICLQIFNPLVQAGEVLEEIYWDQVDMGPNRSVKSVIPADGLVSFDRLRIENAGQTQQQYGIWTFFNPGIQSDRYAVQGKVRYEDVEGTGYLEMWSFFPGGGRYFSRTLGTSGLMKSLQGSSGWRNYALPFSVTDGSGMRPEYLQVNLILPAKGKVFLGPLRLVQYADGEDKLPDGQWWSGRMGGMVGGIAGGLIGLLGALTGVLCGLGRAKGFVLAMMKTVAIFGAICCAAGIVALIKSQPYAVYYPLLLAGLICMIVFGCLIPVVRKRFEGIELRKMQSMDAA